MMDSRRTGQNVTYFAETNGRERKRFGIRQDDRFFHTYVIGKTGTGKSTMLKTMVLQDIANGRGLCLIDPHGDLVKGVLKEVSTTDRERVVYLDTPNANWTFNPLLDVPKGKEALAVAELVEVFKKIWVEEWGPRLEHLLRNVLFTLFEMPKSTLADIQPLLNDRDYRREAANSLKNEEVREFWLKEFAGYSPAFRAVVTAPLQNKLGAFLTDPRVKSIIAAEKSAFDFADVMNGGKVLLVNLSRGEIGEGPTMLLGALLVARIGLAGLARAGSAAGTRRDFILYLDECHLFATTSLATMLAELRKYRIGLILANQYLGQLDTDVREAVLGNVGTLICFRVGADDSIRIAREFEPTFSMSDIVNLPNRTIYLRLMIDGQVSKPFSACSVAIG